MPLLLAGFRFPRDKDRAAADSAEDGARNAKQFETSVVVCRCFAVHQNALRTLVSVEHDESLQIRCPLGLVASAVKVARVVAQCSVSDIMQASRCSALRLILASQNSRQSNGRRFAVKHAGRVVIHACARKMRFSGKSFSSKTAQLARQTFLWIAKFIPLHPKWSVRLRHLSGVPAGSRAAPPSAVAALFCSRFCRPLHCAP